MADVGRDLLEFDPVLDAVMFYIDVFGSCVILFVLRDHHRSFIVALDGGRQRLWEAQLFV